jgi:hypothetical protein
MIRFPRFKTVWAEVAWLRARLTCAIEDFEHTDRLNDRLVRQLIESEETRLVLERVLRARETKIDD